MSESFTNEYALLIEIFAFGLVVAIVVSAVLFQRFTRFRQEADLLETEKAALQKSEERFRSLVRNTSDIITLVGPDDEVLFQSESIRDLLGFDDEKYVGLNVFEVQLVHPDDEGLKRTFFDEMGEAPGVDVTASYRVRHANGSYRYFEAVGRNLLADPTVGGLVITYRDITDRERDRQSLERLASFPDLTPAPIVELGPSGTLTYTNRAARRLFGDLEQKGTDHPALAGIDLVSPTAVGNPENPFTREVDVGETSYHQVIFRVPDSDLTRIYSIDVTERRDFERQLQHQAFHDRLTGLPNRALFMDRLEQALFRVASRKENCGVLFLDLDRFKIINDSLGHETGDRLLVTIARVLREVLRPEDTVVRLGGDEFAILIEEVGSVETVKQLARRVREAIGRPYRLGDQEVFVSASIGVTVSASGEGPEDLLRHADIAMYQAKNSGGGHFEVFDGHMGELAARRLKLEAELRRGLERREFSVYYQPKVDLKSGRMVGMEALVRWIHPERGIVPPLDFIPVAEETGLIRNLGHWVLEESCRQLRVWKTRYRFGEMPSLSVSVNLSAKQFQHPGIVEEIAEVVARHGVEAGDLELEITESAVMEGTEKAVETLQRLKELGVGIAIDDFGTGYSSLGYLKNFPVDVLKIDKSFVDGLGSGGDPAITSAVIELAHALDMKVVAEGIETQDQLSQLKLLGSELGQGYFFSRPLDVPAFEELLSDRQATLAPKSSTA